MAKNIVLTGFMGTGKSSVGRRLAGRLNRRFLDMDTEIEKREGKTASRVFEEDGEAYFRERERELVIELAQSSDLVISTGGGVLMDSRNLDDFQRSGVVICLSTDVDTILNRVSRDSKRPLLQCEDPRARIVEMLEARLPVYRMVPIQVDTTGASHDEVCDRIINTAL